MAVTFLLVPDAAFCVLGVSATLRSCPCAAAGKVIVPVELRPPGFVTVADLPRPRYRHFPLQSYVQWT